MEEYLGVWEWVDLEIDECCPFCGCLCGIHFQQASQMYRHRQRVCPRRSSPRSPIMVEKISSPLSARFIQTFEKRARRRRKVQPAPTNEIKRVQFYA